MSVPGRLTWQYTQTQVMKKQVKKKLVKKSRKKAMTCLMKVWNARHSIPIQKQKKRSKKIKAKEDHHRF